MPGRALVGGIAPGCRSQEASNPERKFNRCHLNFKNYVRMYKKLPNDRPAARKPTEFEKDYTTRSHPLPRNG